MSLRLDRAVRCGGVVVAALNRVRVVSQGGGGSAGFLCRKEPVAILIHTGDRMSVAAVRGGTLTLDEVEPMCPGALADFAAQALALLD